MSLACKLGMGAKNAAKLDLQGAHLNFHGQLPFEKYGAKKSGSGCCHKPISRQISINNEQKQKPRVRMTACIKRAKNGAGSGKLVMKKRKTSIKYPISAMQENLRLLSSLLQVSERIWKLLKES